MSDSERDELRRKRREEGCGTSPPIPDDCRIIHSRDRRPNPCDEDELPNLCAIDRDSFFPPAPPPEPAPIPYAAPSRVTLTNAEAAAECAPEFHVHAGSSITVPPHTFFRLTEALMRIHAQVEDVTERDAASPEEGQIFYVREDDAYWRFMAPGWENMKAYVHPQTVSAYEARITELQEELDARAEEAAEAALDCFYTNVAVTETCEPDPENVAALDEPALGTNVSATVDADVYRSYTDQQTADEAAAAAARLLLVCRWGNRADTYACPSNADEDPTPDGTASIELDGTTPVTSTTPAPAPAANGFTVIGTVSVEPNVVLSALSRADAETRAQAQAEILLSCVYLNEARTDECNDDGEGNDAEEHTRGEAFDSGEDYHNALEGGTGNPTIVPAMRVSGDTIAQANALADALATAALECYWLNDEAQDPEGTCPPDESLPVYHAGLPVGTVARRPIPGEEYEEVVRVTDTGGGVEVLGDTRADIAVSDGDSVGAGEIRSYISVQDANEQAAIIARGRVTCLYCNFPVPAKCDPTSDDHTESVPGELYCEQELAAAQAMAETQGSIPERLKNTGGEVCRFSNTVQYAKCVKPDGALDPDTVYQFEYAEGPVSPNSTPDPTDPNARIAVAAGSFVIEETNWDSGSFATPVDQVNELAQELALLMLDCFFENDEAISEVECGYTVESDGSLTAGIYVGQYSTRSNGGVLNNADHPVVRVPPGTVRSYVSQEDLRFRTRSLAKSIENCFFGNPPMMGYCGFRLIGATFSWNQQADVQEATQGLAQAETIIQDDIHYYVSGTGRIGGSRVSSNSSGYRENLVPGQLDEDDSPVRVAEDAFTSVIEPQEAIVQAAILIDSMLDCFFENEEDDSVIPCGHTVESDGSLTAGPDVGEYSEESNNGNIENGEPVIRIPTGTVRSYVSPNDLQFRARSLAKSMENCFFGNPAMMGYCGFRLSFGGGNISLAWNLATDITQPTSSRSAAETISLDGTTYLVSGTGRVASDPGNVVSDNSSGYRQNTVSGQYDAGDTPVRVAANTFTSTSSREEAIIQAAILVDTMLDCFFENETRLPQDCPEGTLLVDPVGSVSVPARTLRSTVSQNDANNRAQLIANGLRTCVNPDQIVLQGGGIQIDPTHPLLIGRTLGLHEEDWCDAEGNEMKVVILRTAPYVPD